MRHAKLAGILVAILAATAHADDIYVDNVGGDDIGVADTQQPGGTATRPFRTIGRALRAAQRGDRIVLAGTDVPYRESITLQAARHSGLENRDFEIVGNGAILDGSQPVPKNAWEHVKGHIFRFAPFRKPTQMVYLKGIPAERVSVESGQTALPELKALQWCVFERRVYFCVEENHLPQSYDISFAVLPVGVTLYEVRNVRISDLIVQGYRLDGINAHDGVFGATLIRVTCRGNARSGVSVGGASRVRIESSLMGNNGEAQVRAEGKSHVHIIGCDLLDNTAPPVVREGGEVIVENGQADEREARHFSASSSTSVTSRRANQ
jgi:hypothetical protein